MKRRNAKEPKAYGGVARVAAAIALVALGIILLLAAFGSAGFAGEALFETAFSIFGVIAFVLPILIIAIGVSVFLKRTVIAPLVGLGIVLILLSLLALLGIASDSLGGVVGSFIGGLAFDLFQWGAIVLLIALALVGLVIATDVVALVEKLMELLKGAGEKFGTVQLPSLPREGGEGTYGTVAVPEEPLRETTPEREPVVKVFNAESPMEAGVIPNFDAKYNPPPLSILGEDRGKPGVGDIKANANVIKRTFQNFGISVEMDEVSIGPTVTRYAIKPAEGVRLSKVVSLQSNLELALAAHPVRIEAPIPGKSLVGIEVPNASKAMVGLGGVLSSPLWSESEKPLLAAI
ncbi:MAG: DNA translocase FtsK, partial [Minisyncoccia bacterium]